MSDVFDLRATVVDLTARALDLVEHDAGNTLPSGEGRATVERRTAAGVLNLVQQPYAAVTVPHLIRLLAQAARAIADHTGVSPAAVVAGWRQDVAARLDAYDRAGGEW